MTVTRDPAKGWARPASAAEWTEMLSGSGIANPNSAWDCKAGSGNLSDLIESLTLSARGTPNYGVTATGWTGTGVDSTDNTTDGFTAGSGVGPNPATTSQVWMIVAAIQTEPTATRVLLGVNTGSSGCSLIFVPSAGTNQLRINVLGSTSTNGADHGVGDYVFAVRYDRAHSVAKIYSDLVSISGSYGSGVTDGQKGFGPGSTAPGAITIMYIAMWSGSNAETLDDAAIATIRTRIQTPEPILLTAGSGTFTETGTAATLKHGHLVAASSGTFTETGTAATLKHGHLVAASSGTFAETGTAAGLRATRRISADAGAFAETGTAAGLVAGHLVAASSGTFAETGTAAGLRAVRRISADSGAFTETGTDAGLLTTRRISAGAGALVETGTAAGLLAGHVVSADAGALVETGADAGLFPGYRVLAGSGAFAQSGSTDLRYTRIFPAAAGALAETGADAGLFPGYRVLAGQGSLAETGAAVTFRYSRVIAALAADLTVAGSTTLRRERNRRRGHRAVTVASRTTAVAVTGRRATVVVE